METAGVLFRPSFTPSTFNAVSAVRKPLGPRTHSFFNFANYRKPRTSALSVSSKTPPDKESPDFDFNHATSPLNPYWVSARAFRSVKDLAGLYFQKLASTAQAYVALCHGMADSMFPVCLGFSLIVMYDAIGVRRHAGMQAEVLNMIVEDLFQGHPIRKRKLKELLGHTPSQVLAGALLGFAVACVCHQVCLVAA
ncbi:uncharacterized protein LOC115748603 isoform X2 [Rhodamnia argentea]|uniref:Uncharacterized protein LOC115748603 isoform X2 n=1 Tax=Rhodamnia argentea TaxID=178133 RepID=A0A8B8Q3Q2_9MYRT|nr:uncharacterized protein LOC115748603 isoform X2 [Rhodamnia argentea]